MTLGIILLTHLLSIAGPASASFTSIFTATPAPECGFATPDQCFSWINNPVGFIINNILQGPFSFSSWILDNFMSSNNFRLDQSCPTSNGGGANCIYYRLWQVGFAIGVMVLVVAAAMRALREMVGERARVNQAIVGTLVRILVVFGFMSASYSILAWASDASFTMYYGLFTVFASQSASGVPTDSPTHYFIQIANQFNVVNGGWLLIMYVLDFIGIIYATWLILVARFVLLIGTAFAPVVIALSIYSEKAAIFIWWTRKMIGALLVPVFAGAIMGVTTAIVYNLHPQIIPNPDNIWQPQSPLVGFAPIIATVTFIGGCWFLGQAIKHTTGINLGAHSLSTMVAGGMGMMKLGSMAGAAFGMGAKGMDSVGGMLKGSSADLARDKNVAAANVQGGLQAAMLGGGAPGGAQTNNSFWASQNPAAVQSFISQESQQPNFYQTAVQELGPEKTEAAVAGLVAGSHDANMAIARAWTETPAAHTKFVLTQLGQPIGPSMA